MFTWSSVPRESTQLGKQDPFLSLLRNAKSSANEGVRAAQSQRFRGTNWFVVPLKSFILWNNRRHSESDGTGSGTYYILYNVMYTAFII